MKYKLIDSGGVLIDRTPIFGDVKGSLELSFLLPDGGLYIAVFKEDGGLEHKRAIKHGICEVPRELLKGSNNYIALYVMGTTEEGITQTWGCEPLLISSFYTLQRTQWQISGGMTDSGALKRIAELECALAGTLSELRSCKELLAAQGKELGELKEAVSKHINKKTIR